MMKHTSLSLVPSTSATQALSKFCLIGKVLTSKTLEEKEVETLCANLWKTRVKVDTPLLGHTSSNVFRFGFEKVADKRWVVDIGLWCIKGHQRGDCSLGSPVSILDVKGGKYPLFGPRLNFRYPYASCFSGNLHISSSCAKSFEKKVKAVFGSGRPRVVNGSPSPVPVGGLDCGNGLGSREQVSILVPHSKNGIFLGPRIDNTWVRKSSGMAKASCARNSHDSGNGKLKQILGDDPIFEDLLDIERDLNFKKRLESCVGAVIEVKLHFVHWVGGPSAVGPSKIVVSGPVGSLGCVTPVRLPAPQHTGFVVSPRLRGALGCEVLGSGGSGAMGVGGLKGPLASRDVGLLSKYSLDTRPFEKPVLLHGSTPLISSGLDRDHVVRLEEERALSNFFKAQEDYIHEIENLGSLGKNKRKSFGVDIGVQPTSECNDRTTPVKKRRLDFETLSLGEELGLSVRRFKRVVRDFPKGTGPNGGARESNGVQLSNNYLEELLDSEESLWDSPLD
ncbi:hypothetical protein G4B88_013423 [Cannabis sativa]|uniref:DUF4283 domain-containing protein n=1 Tax=Cannabis sativa TaxID=3483 RepID=A0A7J6DIW1_CANSA|nr:hypothetical protein G4B88_013423 [Cannabis sativa]